MVGNCMILLPTYRRRLQSYSRLRPLSHAPLGCLPLHWASNTHSRQLTYDHCLTNLPQRPTLTIRFLSTAPV